MIQNGEKTLPGIAEDRGLPIKKFSGIARTGQDDLDPSLVSAVFRTPASGKEDEKSAGSAALANGDQVLFTINRVIPGDPEKVTDPEREQIKHVVEQRNGQDLFSDYERGLYELADIVIHENEL